MGQLDPQLAKDRLLAEAVRFGEPGRAHDTALQQLNERDRVAVTTLRRVIVGQIADELAVTLNAAAPDSIVVDAIFDTLQQAKWLDAPALISNLQQHTLLSRLTARLREASARDAGDPPHVEAELARPYGALQGPAIRKLVWGVALAVYGTRDDAELPNGVLAQSVELTIATLAKRVAAVPASDDILAIIVSNIAETAAVSTELVNARLAAADMPALLLMLRASNMPRDDAVELAARLAWAWGWATPSDDTRLVNLVDGYDALTRNEARTALLPLTLDPDHRSAIASFIRSGGQR
jgi:hypothetical protein